MIETCQIDIFQNRLAKTVQTSQFAVLPVSEGFPLQLLSLDRSG
jgi:hypothetical protein